MNHQDLQKRIDEVIDHWIEEVHRYSLEDLSRKSYDESWSMGQVYIHLWMAAKGFFFKQAEKCLTQQGSIKGGRKNLIGWYAFRKGTFPVARIKMPGSVGVQPIPPDSKELILKRMEEIKELSHQYIARLHNFDPKYKAKHPFLGYLNAEEWVQLNEMHFRHHLKQKARIEERFGLTKK